MARVVASQSPSATTKGKPVSRSQRLRAIYLSPDFFIGVIVGCGLALLPTFIPAVVPNGFAFFMALAGIAAAVAALILAPMALLANALTPGFKKLLQRVPGGVSETFRPFAQVAAIAALASLSSLIVAILSPLAFTTFPWVIWVAVAIPLSLFVWALAGSVQAVYYLIDMMRTADEFDLLEARKADAKQARALHNEKGNQANF